jgi:vancomycin resistance protein YoaR
LRAEATPASVRVRRKKPPAYRLAWRWTVAVGVALAVGIGFIGILYAGSPERLASGVRIAGVNVGGLTTGQAKQLLERKAASLQHVPVVFTAAGREWRITPAHLDVTVDWGAAVAAAQKQGGGFGPFRGLRRLSVRFFGADVSPQAHVWTAALNYELGLLAKRIDHPHRDAAIVRRGLAAHVVPGSTGTVLDRSAAAQTLVSALASFSRHPVALPVSSDPPRVTPDDLAPALAQTKVALRSTVVLKRGPTRWRLPRREIASILRLPAHGRSALTIGGAGAATFFHRLAKQVNHPPRNGDWAVNSHGKLHLVASHPGYEMVPGATRKAVFAAVTSPTNRVATIPVAVTQPSRSTAQAKAMGITGLVGGYTTIFSGDTGRIHNVELVAHLIDHTLIAPGATFSFNQTTGDRNAAKGFVEAPVIINGEVGTGLGGGVCQVSTTTFNAAFEAGLDITARTNHALYISHYPLGRDATVNYPDTDLKFVNDTPHWLLLRTFISSDALTVNLYGTPQHRRVVSTATPLKTDGPMPIKRIPDPSLLEGERVIISDGTPPTSTSVHRLVYSASGKLLHDDTWYSSYDGIPQVRKVGTKVPPPPPPKKTTTTTTTTTQTTTTTGGTTTSKKP